MDRMEVRLDAATERRLLALTAKLELRRPDIIRMAVRVLAEREGVELRQDTSSVALDAYLHPDR